MYTGPPVCTRCGGALDSALQPCWCGGHSQYWAGDAPAA